MDQSMSESPYCLETKMDVEESKFCRAEYDIMIGLGKTNS